MSLSLNRALAYAAGVLAIGALLVGDRAGRNENTYAGVTAVELATWIKEHKSDLRIIDLRSAEEFAAYHIPTAEHGAGAATLPSATTVVVYSDVGSPEDAARASALRAVVGGAEVSVLRGGVNAWLNDIMLPRLPPDPTPEQRQRYTIQSELSHYFGGKPSSLGIDTARSSTAQAVTKLRRMGC